MLTMEDGYGKLKLIVWKRYDNGNHILTYINNALLESGFYTIGFDDGMLREYDANLVTENMYAQVD